MFHCYLDDFTVGSTFETDGKTVSEAEILEFALKYDPQPFHMDVEAVHRGHDRARRGLEAAGFLSGAVMHRKDAADPEAIHHALADHGVAAAAIDRAYGRGVMPLSFEALKGQRFRWCFGGIQILRMHWRSLLPGRRTPHNRLTLGQRWAYLVGGLQWFGDLAAVVFTFFLLAGAVDAITGEGLVIRRLSGLVLVAVVSLVVLGAVRSVALVRRSSEP